MFSKFGKMMLIISYIIFATACKSKASYAPSLGDLTSQTGWCPEDGACNVTLLAKKSLIFKTDEFGIGYAEVDKGENDLLILEYVRNDIPDTVDGHYIERIYFELPKQDKQLHLDTKNLQEFNLFFERLCYCKGQTGYYKITDGHLIINQISPTRFHFKLIFEMKDVPHILNDVDQIIDRS